MNEISRTYHIIIKRRNDPELLGNWKKLSISHSSACPDYPHGGGWCSKPGYRQRTPYITSDSATLAPTVLISTPARSGKRCSTPWAQATYSATKDQRRYRGYAPYGAAECDTLEYAKHGQGFRCQQSYNMSNMATTQSQTPSGRNIQTQPGQAIRRKTSRYRRPVSQPAGQGACFMRRREEPDSSPRQDTTVIPVTSWYSRASNLRLHAARDNDVIRRFKYARRQGYRRLYASAPAPGIYPVLTAYQCQDPAGLRPALNSGQLRRPQTSAGPKMAQTESTVSSSLYTDIQFMAQYGGTLVPGNHRQTHSSRFIQKRSRVDQSHYAISGKSQPESTRFYLGRIG